MLDEKIIEIQGQTKPLTKAGLTLALNLIRQGKTTPEIVAELNSSPSYFVETSFHEKLLNEAKRQTRIQYLSFLVLVAIFGANLGSV